MSFAGSPTGLQMHIQGRVFHTMGGQPMKILVQHLFRSKGGSKKFPFPINSVKRKWALSFHGLPTLTQVVAVVSAPTRWGANLFAIPKCCPSMCYEGAPPAWKPPDDFTASMPRFLRHLWENEPSSAPGKWGRPRRGTSSF